jgi:single-stranded-DNA-specific exonuclease
MHIRDALEAIHSRHPELMGKFGGHAMAAGLSLEAQNFEAFRAAFDVEARRWLDAADLAGVLHTDGELPADLLTLEGAEMLRDAGPWGQAFPEPLFDGVFGLKERRIVGNGHLKLLLEHPAGRRCEAIAFGQTGEHIPETCRAVRIAYRPDVNEYRGERRLQLLVEYIEAA